MLVKVFKYAVALTGGIATGKSTVAKIFATLGFEMIDADKVGHEVLDAQSLQIAEMFGADIVINGKVDRKALGAIVFADKSKRQALEQLLHPLIYDEIEKRAKSLDEKKKVYLVDIPLFYEGSRYPIEKVLLAYTPQDLQLQRLMQRDESTEQEAQQRIDSQISIEEKVKKARYVIDNSATLTDLENECKRVALEIKKDFEWM
ncbi:MAG: dephospho-CoA kinase [Sulfurovum sp.]|nr:dephospho-CoA kinase [Sulfurovum sp.]